MYLHPPSGFKPLGGLLPTLNFPTKLVICFGYNIGLLSALADGLRVQLTL